MYVGISGTMSLGDMAAEVGIELPAIVAAIKVSFDAESFDSIVAMDEDGDEFKPPIRAMMEAMIGAPLEEVAIKVVRKHLGV